MGTSGIVAFAFGVPDTIRANRQIGHIATELAKGLTAPVFTQHDVTVGPGIEVERIAQDSGNNPPPTLRIARAAVQWARRRGLDMLWIVAAEPHRWRALRDVKRAIQEVGGAIEASVCQEIGQYTEHSWYCRDSLQERTRSRSAWEKRERILRRLPFVIYKYVAC